MVRRRPMKLQNSKRNRFLTLFGALLVLLIVAAPQAARADTCDIGADGSSAGDFYNSYLHNLTNEAGKISTVHHDFINNSPTLDIKLHYCTTLIDDVIKLIAATGNPKALLTLALFSAVEAFLNAICGVAVQVITDFTKLVTSAYGLMCMSMPQLHLGVHLPGINGCPGTPLLSLGLVNSQPMSNPTNATGGPSSWQIWGASPVYVPKGP